LFGRNGPIFCRITIPVTPVDVTRVNRGRESLISLGVDIAHLMSQLCNFGFELLDTENILISDAIVELARRIVPFATLTRQLSIAPNLGSPAVDTGIDGASFARTFG
jgi:hypothetical protein